MFKTTTMELYRRPQAALRALHFIFPAILLTYFLVAKSISVCALQNLRSREHKIQRKPLIVLQVAVLILYTIEAFLLVFDALLNYSGNSSPNSNIHTLLEVFIWTLLTTTLIESGDDIVWYPLYGSWIISVVTEIVLFGLEIPIVTPFKSEAPNSFTYTRIVLQVLRLAFLVLLPILYFHRRTTYQLEKDEESTSLLPFADTSSAKEDLQMHATYGSIEVTCSELFEPGDDDAEQSKKDRLKEDHLQQLKNSNSWINYINRFSVFVPIIWPTGQTRVQLSILGVVICLSADRVLNLLIPRQLGIVIDLLSNTLVNQASFPGMQLVLYCLYRFLASYNTIGELEAILWLPFEQHATRAIKAAAHTKVMALSRDFQTQKSSGEIIKSIDQGMNVIWLFKRFSMYMLPYTLDMLLFGIYMSFVFGAYMALLLGITAILFIWVSAHFAAKRINPQRDVFKKDRKEAQLMFESVGHWDTVTYFGGQVYETDRLSKALHLRFLAEFNLRWLMFQGNFSKGVVKQLGFATACALVMYQIIQDTKKIGSFVMMISYFFSVQCDLQALTAIGSSFLEDLVEAEMLRDLLLIESSVKDGPAPFRLFKGAVLFDDVRFGYDDEKAIIRNFSFSAEAGQRIALVGETGAGKTTVLRLLFRFYDVHTGKIMIDGQDIRNVTLSTLRGDIGVVPQDPLLFDCSIMDNVRYSRLEASDEEVVEACKAAAVHNKVLTYTDGYQTKVGEHGIKLSGGEKQQIAIARVMLKNPKIILLDEATSSVDSETESLIQTALQRLTRGRTTFTIAHRMSTINGSDVILVMKDGTIVEQGSPSELLEGNSHYSRIWKNQFGINEGSIPDEIKAVNESDHNEQGRSAVSGHILERSGSSFRPDAPEFVPHCQGSTEASSGNPSHVHLEKCHQHSQEDTSNHSYSRGVSTQKNDRGLLKCLNSELNRAETKPTDESEATSEAVTADSRLATAGSKYNGLVDEGPPKNNPPRRLNRWQRRRQARSEPHGSAMSSSQVDGPSKNPASAESKAKAASRRVTGPGIYPSGATIAKSSDQNSNNVKLPSQNVRRKRQRQLRIKRIQQPGSGSGLTSGEASSAWSSDNLASSMPKTPLSTPNNEVNHPIEKDISHTANRLSVRRTSNVHFALEA